MNMYDYNALCEIANSINDEYTKNTFLETIRRYNNCLEELQRKDNIINELEKYFFGELQLYGGGGIAEENYKKLIELKEKRLKELENGKE